MRKNNFRLRFVSNRERDKVAWKEQIVKYKNDKVLRISESKLHFANTAKDILLNLRIFFEANDGCLLMTW